MDSGGIEGALADGVGDACQCGDVSDDGAVAQADLDAIRQQLTDPHRNRFRSAQVRRCPRRPLRHCRGREAPATSCRPRVGGGFRTELHRWRASLRTKASTTSTPRASSTSNSLSNPTTGRRCAGKAMEAPGASQPNVISEVLCRFRALAVAFPRTPSASIALQLVPRGRRNRRHAPLQYRLAEKRLNRLGLRHSALTEAGFPGVCPRATSRWTAQDDPQQQQPGCHPHQDLLQLPLPARHRNPRAEMRPCPGPGEYRLPANLLEYRPHR